jgi:hypothetical protein
MVGTQYFGYLLIMLSAALLAQHWHERLDLKSRPGRPQDHSFWRHRLQRRSVASALIGVVGAAMTLVDRVPRNARSLSAYLFALLLAGGVILAIALSDMRAARKRREGEQLEMLAEELRKATPAPSKPD